MQAEEYRHNVEALDFAIAHLRNTRKVLKPFMSKKVRRKISQFIETLLVLREQQSADASSADLIEALNI